MFRINLIIFSLIFSSNLLSLDIYDNLPTIETSRTILRKLDISDAKDIFEFASDAEVVKLTALFKQQSDIQETVNYIQKCLDNYAKKQSLIWAIVHKESNKVIGLFSYFSFIPTSFKAEIGGAGSRLFWSQGIGTEVTKAMISFGFEKMNLNRIQATCDPRNLASIQLIEKAGMQYEGLLRQFYYLQDKFCDRKIYSILKEEYKK